MLWVNSCFVHKAHGLHTRNSYSMHLCTEQEFLKHRTCVLCTEQEFLKQRTCVLCAEQEFLKQRTCVLCMEQEFLKHRTCILCTEQEFLKHRTCVCAHSRSSPNIEHGFVYRTGVPHTQSRTQNMQIDYLV